jgi:hypothetical protein
VRKSYKIKELIPALFLLSTYGFTFVKPALWSDDYVAVANPNQLSQSLLGDLRPIWALSNLFTFTFLPTQISGVLFRILAVFGLYMTYKRILAELSPFFQNSDKHRLLFLALLALPSVSIFVHWSVFWQNGFALYFSLLSFHFFAKEKTAFNCLLSALFFAIAFLTYPPSSFACFGILAILVRYQLAPKILSWASILQYFLISTSAALSSFSLFVSVNRLIEIEINERVNIISMGDILTKLQYVMKVILLPFNIYGVSSPTNPLNALMIVIVLSVFLYSHTSKFMRTQSTMSHSNNLKASVLLLVSLTPILLSTDNQLEFRLIAGSSMYITYVFLDTISTFWKSINNASFFHIIRHRQVKVESLLFLFLTIACITCNLRYINFFEFQFSSARTFVIEETKKCDLKNPDTIILVAPMTNPVYVPRIGIYSMTTDLASSWVPIPATRYFLKTDKVQFFDREAHGEFLTNPSYCLIELDKITSRLEPKWLW